MAQQLAHFRKSITFRFASGVTGADLTQTKAISALGEILNIRQITSTFTDGAQTAQLTLVDEAGILLWDGGAQADGVTKSHEFATDRRVLAGNDFLKCILSADPGVSGAIINVLVSCFGRE